MKSLPKRRAIRLLLFGVAGALVMLAAALALSCATVVTPPPAPADPAWVYIIDHGRTSSLLLPTPEGGLMRYVYGDWAWYALMDERVRSGLRALFWPSQGTLGRHPYPGPNTPENVERFFYQWSEAIHPLTVSRARALALAGRLDSRFKRALATRHANLEYNLEFVHDPESYHIFHNSNHEIAAWLEELGCQVRGPAIYAKWKVKTPAP